MLLSITTTHEPARDLGYLVAKHPDRVQTFSLGQGTATVFWPEAGASRATVCLMVEVDPISLVRGRPGAHSAGPLAQYVNDRPYVASSLLCTAISRVFGSALNGTSRERPELVDVPLPLEAHLPVIPARGGERLLRELFEPLGYTVTAVRHPRDETVSAWGDSRLFTLTLRGTVPLCTLLRHLYVLIPVLDDDKHYWVGPGEVDKLVAKGEGWLRGHPAWQQILRRSLKHRSGLVRAARTALLLDGGADPARSERAAQEAVLEAPIRLQDRRIAAIVSELEALGASRVLDLGCGEGQLLEALLRRSSFREVVGIDVSVSELERAERRLRLDDLAPKVRERLILRQGSVLYADERLSGYDAAALVEVIEHVEPDRLDLLSANVFGAMSPRAVLVSTPNQEYNAMFERMAPGSMRHPDHRFEWTRAEFRSWAEGIAEQYGYTVTIKPIGDTDPVLGPPTQLGVFVR